MQAYIPDIIIDRVDELSIESAALLKNFLLPFLPHLLNLSNPSAEETGKQLGLTLSKDSWETAKQLWDELSPSVESDLSVQEAASRIVSDQSNTEAQSFLEDFLDKRLAADPLLERSLQSLLNSKSKVVTGAVSVNQSTRGNQDISICQSSNEVNIGQSNYRNASIHGGVENSTFIVGDHNHFNSHLIKKNKPIPSDVRYGSQNFVGREQDLCELDKLLREEEVVAVCAVHGMGGVGKTELALQYALSDKFRHRYVACYWFSLREVDLATQVLLKAAPYLAMPEEVKKLSDASEKAKWCWQNWHPVDGDILVILDDVRSLEDIPKQAMPLDRRFKVVLTTRQKNLSSSFRELLLGVLPLEKSLELLEKVVGRERISEELDIAESICHHLGNLPLALDLAATYLLEDEMLSLSEYLEQLSLTDESLSDELIERIQAEKGVISAFDLSWQRLQQGFSSRLAMLFSQFANTEIPWKQLIEPAIKHLKWEAADVKKGRTELVNLHLITIEGRKNISVHRLLHEYFSCQLDQLDDLFVTSLHTAIASSTVDLAEQIPYGLAKLDVETFSPCIPHLEKVSEQFLGQIPNPDDKLIWTFLGTARFHDGQGLYDKAVISYKKCCEVLGVHLGREHHAFATSLCNLAGCYETQGRYQEAEPLFQESLKIREEKLGADHPDVAQTLNGLAGLYESQARYKESESLYLRAIEIYEKSSPSDVSMVLNNLSVLYKLQYRYKAAETLLYRSLEIAQYFWGSEHQKVTTILGNLGEIFEAQGRYKEAEKILQRVLAIKKQQLGEDHPDVAISMNSLAKTLMSMGDYENPESILSDSLEILERRLGEKHPTVVINLNNLASLYDSQSRYQEAELCYKRAIKIGEKVHDENHPSLADIISNLAGLYQLQCRYDESELLFKRAMSIQEQESNPNHLGLAMTLNNLSNLYHAKGHYKEAEQLLHRSLNIQKRILGKGHQSIGLTMSNLIGVYQSQGRHRDAVKALEKLIGLSNSPLMAEDPKSAHILGELARSLQFQGQYEEAESLYRKSLGILENIFGENAPKTLTVYSNLALLYLEQARYSEAEFLFTKTLEFQKQCLGEAHTDVVRNLSNLAVLYKLQGRHAEAETLSRNALETLEGKLGSNHPDVSTTIHNLAEICRDKGSYNEAELLLGKALAASQEQLGHNHPDTAKTLGSLGLLYQQQGDYSKSNEFLQKAKRIFEETLGANHPDLAMNLNNLALLYEAKGQYKRAEKVARKALTILENRLGEHHPQTLNVGLAVKGLRLQSLLNCTRQDVLMILGMLAKVADVSSLAVAHQISLLEVIISNPKLLKGLKESYKR